jgi:hypothetical protein
MNKKLIKILAAGGATLGAATAVPAILVSCSDNNGNDSNSNIKKFNKYINLYDPLPNFPTGLTAQQTGIVIGTMKQTNVHLDGSETSLTTPGRLMLTSKLDTVSGNNQI